MNTLAQSNRKPKEPLQCQVSVAFLDQDDFRAEFPETTSLGQIKLRAIAHFGMGSAPVAKYVLRHQGGNCREDQRLVDLGGREFSFQLVSRTETGRFGETLFLR